MAFETVLWIHAWFLESEHATIKELEKNQNSCLSSNSMGHQRLRAFSVLKSHLFYMYQEIRYTTKTTMWSQERLHCLGANIRGNRYQHGWLLWASVLWHLMGINGKAVMVCTGENSRTRDEKNGNYQTCGGSMRHNS